MNPQTPRHDFEPPRGRQDAIRNGVAKIRPEGSQAFWVNIKKPRLTESIFWESPLQIDIIKSPKMVPVYGLLLLSQNSEMEVIRDQEQSIGRFGFNL